MIKSQTFFDSPSDYNDYLPRWDMMEHITNGPAKLKEVDLTTNGTYLIKTPAANGNQSHTDERYKRYVHGAWLAPYTSTTLTGFLGMLFRVAPVPPKLPVRMEYIIDDADGNGLSLDQHAQNTAEQLIKLGRHIVLVDRPLGVAVSFIDENAGLRSSFKSYPADALRYWNNDKTVFILYDPFDKPDDGEEFKTTQVDAFRILRLENGVYTTELVNEKNEPIIRVDRDGSEIPAKIAPVDANGNPLDFIPIVVFGSKDNQPDVDPIPLEPIAATNIAQYRNSADLESQARQAGASTLHIASSLYGQARTQTKDGTAQQPAEIRTGEDAAIITETGGTVSYVSVTPNTFVGKLHEEKLAEMIKLGASVITPAGGQETAEGVRTRSATQASQLTVIRNNLTDGYTDLLKMATLIHVKDGEVEGKYDINSSFFDTRQTPDERRVLLEELNSDAITKEMYFARLLKTGDLPDDADPAELAEQVASNPRGGGFDLGDQSSN